MAIKIRSGVFETNSSSSHSLVFSKKDRKTKYPLELDANHECYDDVETGLLCVRFGEFGWGPALLVDPRDKLNYLMTQVANEVIPSDEDLSWKEIQQKLLASKKVQNILAIVQKHVPGVKGFKFLRSGESPDEEEENTLPSYSYPVGYIDHQSWGVAHEVDPEELIFNDKILVIIDNDNSCHFADWLPGWDDETAECTLPPTKDPEELFEMNGYDFDYSDRWW